MVYKSVVAVGFRGVETNLYLKVKIDGCRYQNVGTVKGPKIKQYVGMVSHLLFNYRNFRKHLL